MSSFPSLEPIFRLFSNNKGRKAVGITGICFFLFFSYFHLSTLLAAEPLGWDDLNLYGGQVKTIAFDPVNPNIMFAGTWMGDGLFKSTDGGTTWHSIDGFRNQSVRSISFDPLNHMTIWVTAWAYIYKSEDGGISWKSLDPGYENDTYYFSLALDPSYSNIVYVGTTGEGGSLDIGFSFSKPLTVEKPGRSSRSPSITR